MLPFRIPRREPLVPGTLVRRYKRFLADVDLADGGRVTAHCVNTGAMEGLVQPGARVWLSRASNSRRKLAWTWELIELAGEVIGANTLEANRIVRRLLAARRLHGFSRWSEMAAERRYGERSRADFWLRRGRRETFLEVKNCHLIYPDGRAYFPDAVSTRGTEHLRQLARVAAGEHRARVLFVVQTPGAKALRPSDAHDPAFAAAAREARAAGVRFAAVEVLHTPAEMVVTRRLPVDLRPYRTARVARWRAAARS